jgi:hypothetical protein
MSPQCDKVIQIFSLNMPMWDIFFTSTHSLVTCLIQLHVESELSVFSSFPHSLYVCKLFTNVASSLLEFLWDIQIHLFVWQVSVPPTRDVFSLQTLSTFLPCPRASLEAGGYCSEGLTDWDHWCYVLSLIWILYSKSITLHNHIFINLCIHSKLNLESENMVIRCVHKECFDLSQQLIVRLSVFSQEEKLQFLT